MKTLVKTYKDYPRLKRYYTDLLAKYISADFTKVIPLPGGDFIERVRTKLLCKRLADMKTKAQNYAKQIINYEYRKDKIAFIHAVYHVLNLTESNKNKNTLILEVSQPGTYSISVDGEDVNKFILKFLDWTYVFISKEFEPHFPVGNKNVKALRVNRKNKHIVVFVDNLNYRYDYYSSRRRKTKHIYPKSFVVTQNTVSLCLEVENFYAHSKYGQHRAMYYVLVGVKKNKEKFTSVVKRLKKQKTQTNNTEENT